MPAIRILTDRVANQIAAGEVIERPVAVVKELVENSLDSGATRIEINFRNGGKNFIRVEDNGHGMSPDNSMLALERHGTSKISEVSDLLKVNTFGFRGEALPSMASVSRFTMRTRDQAWGYGTEILFNGGKFIQQKEIGMPAGTTVEVANLFNSVPARRKFLKTDNTEAAHIIRLSRLYAVANPGTSFTLMENGRVIFRSPVSPNLSERVREIFGKQVADLLMEINAEENDLQLTGLIGKPGAGRSTRQDMIAYVNQRPVDSRTLYYALIEAYHTYLPKGRYPLAFIFLKMNPQGVDVNVHPAKREVRFHEEGRVRQFLMRALLDRLRETSRSEFSSPTNADVVDIKPVLSPPVTSRMETILKPTIHETTPSKEKRQQLRWKYIGLVHDIFAIFETETGLILLNTRGARERIVFESIQARLASNELMSQKLLFPLPLELDPVLSTTLGNHLDFFGDNGFTIELFGRNFYRVEALPDWLDPGLGEDFIRDLITRIHERGLRPDKPDLAHEEIARLASVQASRKSPDQSESEMNRIAQKLAACKNPLNDPRGRPTYIEISRTDLDKKFFR